LGIHRYWWPVFVVAGALIALDIPMAYVFLGAAANPSAVAGRTPMGGWAGFAVLLMLEPTIALAPLTYFTAKQIEDERKREEADRRRVVETERRARVEASMVDLVPEDSERAEEWRKMAEEREARRRDGPAGELRKTGA
jgi:hypothetical protein